MQFISQGEEGLQGLPGVPGQPGQKVLTYFLTKKEKKTLYLNLVYFTDSLALFI